MKNRVFPFLVLLLLAFIIFWLRLFWLQIIKGKEYRRLAEGNRIQIVKIPALRGIVYDRNNYPLVRNRPEGREYIYGPALAHVLGYIGEISQEEFKDNSNRNIGDLVGKMGIEQQYDKLICGKDGGILVETNAAGEIVREIKREDPKEGSNLTLTLDKGLQQKAFSLLKDEKAVIIASKPQTGEILALVSSPSFDPNLFTLSSVPGSELRLRSGNEIPKILNDPDQPMFNRAISGLYPPGSVFKIVTVIAGLEEEKINQSTLVEDTGEIKVGRFTYGNWYFRQYGKTEGMVDILKAIQRSNDIYFYKVGEWLGITKLMEWAKYFGLGQATGIDLSGEAAGLIPTPEWKKKHKLEDWYLGDTYITAIGQGDLQLTPLQVNQLASVVASDGQLCQPHLLKEFKDSCQELKIKPENLSLLKEGMKKACEEGGTGWPLVKFKVQNKKLKVDERLNPLEGEWVEIPTGCKTGSAEYGDPQNKTHAWFTVFAPWKDPEIVVTVLVEAGGEGSSVAGPIARDLLKYYFEEK